MTAAENYRRLASAFDQTVASVEAWDAPSPCDEWTARDVLEHVLSSEVDFPGKVGLTFQRSIDLSNDPLGAWREVRDGMQAILDDPAKASLTYEAFGAQTSLADSVDRFICFDLIFHRWDIGRAAGLPIEIAAADIAASNAFLDAMGSMFYDYGASKPAIPIDESASDQDKVLGRVGRDPHWSAS
ncbi:MAG: maleylpyruvate isomerase family mycothiol-dependent enzyme [Aeromicrobium sp.]